jgi:hypothetical protein
MSTEDSARPPGPTQADLASTVGRLAASGFTEAQLVALLQGLAEAVENGKRQWDLTLHDLSAYTAFSLGAFTGQVIQDAEEHGYSRGKADALDGWPSLPENVRMLITDAALLLHRAIFEGEADLARDFGVWCQHRDAVYAGRFGRYALTADGSGVDTGGAS